MRSKSSNHHDVEPDEFGFQVAGHDFEPGSGNPANSPDEVIGEIALVLVVILGAVVAIHMVLAALHIG